MVGQVLRLQYFEGTDTFGAEDLGQLLVGSEELIVLWVLEFVFLEVGPEVLQALGPGSLLQADDGGQLWADFHWSSKYTSLWHLGSPFSCRSVGFLDSR